MLAGFLQFFSASQNKPCAYMVSMRQPELICIIWLSIKSSYISPGFSTRFNTVHQRQRWEVFHIQVQTLWSYIVSNPSPPNTFWVGVWTHKHLLRRPLGESNQILEDYGIHGQLFNGCCNPWNGFHGICFVKYDFEGCLEKRVAILVQYSTVTMDCPSLGDRRMIKILLMVQKSHSQPPGM